MNKLRLDEEEKSLLESVENEEWVSVKNISTEKKRLREYAKATMKKDKRLNIRISSRDLMEIQRRAVKEGIPYQTLISSILHKFINGCFVEKLS